MTRWIFLCPLARNMFRDKTNPMSNNFTGGSSYHTLWLKALCSVQNEHYYTYMCVIQCLWQRNEAWRFKNDTNSSVSGSVSEMICHVNSDSVKWSKPLTQFYFFSKIKIMLTIVAEDAIVIIILQHAIFAFKNPLRITMEFFATIWADLLCDITFTIFFF